MSPNLCFHCQLIFEHWDENIKYYSLSRWRHCENIFALRASATTGCHLCAQFYRNLVNRGYADELVNSTVDLLNEGLPVGPGRVMVIPFDRLVSGAQNECRLLELHFRIPETVAEKDIDVESVESDSDDAASYDSEVGRCIEYVCKVILIPVTVVEGAFLDMEMSITLPPNSVQSLEIAKLWMGRCFSTHETCHVSHRIAPTRLLFVDHEKFKLCQSSEFDYPPPYVTLSHCWGALKLLKLTTKNMKGFQAGMPLGVLCKTFQDAVYITLQLGFHYLWIDSMCIIQDNPEDWRFESRLMSRVYGLSSVNIAATSAPDGDTGCFFDRDPNHASQHRVKAIENEREVVYDCVEDGMYDACLLSTPLAHRAWVIQERLLAPRTLHFSSTQVFWECNESTACETFPVQFPAELSYGDFHLQKQPVTRSLWSKIVQLYTRCDLTLGKDKLVAISGLAKHIHDQTGEQYLAGLWRGGLEAQLCWKSRTATPRPEEPRAPTWSWASVDGTVNLSSLHSGEVRLHIEVQSVSIEPFNPFGEVLWGSINIHCHSLMHGSLEAVGGLVVQQILVGSNPIPATISLDCHDWTQSPDVYILPVMDVISLGVTRGLLLEYHSELKYPGSPAGGYRRVGVFEMSETAFLDLKATASPETSQIVTPPGDMPTGRDINLV